MFETAQLMADRAKELAAEMLEASPDDIVIGMDGRVGVTGVPAKALTWGQLAVGAKEKGEPLLIQHDFTSDGLDVPVRRAHRGGGGRHRDRPRRARFVTSRSTTAARS